MSGLELVASILAVITACDKVVSITRQWISNIKDIPQSLQVTQIEASYIRGLLESLKALGYSNEIHPFNVARLGNIGDHEGLLRVLQKLLTELEKHLTPSHKKITKRKRLKLEMNLETLAWPLKQDKIDKLLEQLQRLTKVVSFILLQELQ
jgi:hypothetical protein